MKRRTYYEKFAASPKRRRLLRQEELILEVTEALASALNQTGITRVELANRLGKSKSFVSQLFGGGRNLTLRTVADVADALGHSVRIVIRPEQAHDAVVYQLHCVKPENWPSSVTDGVSEATETKGMAA